MVFRNPNIRLSCFFDCSRVCYILLLSLIIFLIVGFALVSFKSKFCPKVYFEKGVLTRSFAATLMGAANFFVGYGSRATNVL